MKLPAIPWEKLPAVPWRFRILPVLMAPIATVVFLKMTHHMSERIDGWRYAGVISCVTAFSTVVSFLAALGIIESVRFLDRRR